MQVQLKCQWKSQIVEGSNGWAKPKREVHSLTVMDVNKDKLGSTCTVAIWKLKVNWFVFKLTNDLTIHSSRPVWPIFNSVATFPDLSESTDWSNGQKFDHQVLTNTFFFEDKLCLLWQRNSAAATVEGLNGSCWSPPSRQRAEESLVHIQQRASSLPPVSWRQICFSSHVVWEYSHIFARKREKTQIVWFLMFRLTGSTCRSTVLSVSLPIMKSVTASMQSLCKI